MHIWFAFFQLVRMAFLAPWRGIESVLSSTFAFVNQFFDFPVVFFFLNGFYRDVFLYVSVLLRCSHAVWSRKTLQIAEMEFA